MTGKSHSENKEFRTITTKIMQYYLTEKALGVKIEETTSTQIRIEV